MLKRGLLSSADCAKLQERVDAVLAADVGHSEVVLARYGVSPQADETAAQTLSRTMAMWSGVQGGRTGTLLNTDWTGPVLHESQGRYSGEKEFARGGMGRIVAARDDVLERDVIIKELLHYRAGADATTLAEECPQASGPMTRRFLQEARITAGLEHPSIIPVYELGIRRDGTPYYTMKHVRGRTLSQAITETKTLSDRIKLLPHFVDLCQAVAYAHSRGVIHRDLKPANVILGAFGETVVIDWGLAKRRGETDTHRADSGMASAAAGPANADSGDMTLPGSTIGTPQYMAPEQARGDFERVREWTDVYALGVILYEIIAGRSPYEWTNVEQVMRDVIERTPTPLEVLVPNAPRELGAICARSMRKDPEQRYASAKELAEEVIRFLAGAVVQAYDYRFSEHLKRFVRRRWKTMAGAAAAFLILLAMGLYSYAQVMHERDAAEQARVMAEQERGRAESARGDATRALYGAYVSLATSHVTDMRFDQARGLLEQCPAEYRNWEWGHLEFLCNQDYRSFPQTLERNLLAARSGYTVNPRAHLVMLESPGGGDYTLADALTGDVVRVIGTDADGMVCMSPGGRWLVRRFSNKGLILPINSEEEYLNFDFMNHWIWCLELCPDDRTMAVRTAPEQVTVWDIEAREKRCTIEELGLAMCRLSSDGSCIAAMSDRGLVKNAVSGPLAFRDTATGAELGRIDEVTATAMAFVPGERRLIVGGPDGTLSCYVPDQVAPVWEVKAHDSPVAVVAFGPVAAGSGETGASVVSSGVRRSVVVTDAATGAERRRLACRTGEISALAASDDGQRVAAACGNRVYVWNLNAGDSRRVFEGHSDPVAGLAFSPDGRQVYSVSRSEAKVWTIDHPGVTQRVEDTTAAAVTRDGIVTTISKAGSVRAYAVATGAKLGQARELDAAPDAVLMCADGTRALLESDGGIALWNLETATLVATVSGGARNLDGAAFSPDGRRFVVRSLDTLAQNASLYVHEADNGAQECMIQLYDQGGPWGAGANVCAFSPAGDRLAVSTMQRVAFYALPEGVESDAVTIPEQAGRRFSGLCYNPAGSHLALTTGNNGVGLLDVASGRLHELGRHSRPVTALAFDATGERLFSGDEGGYVIVWETRAGRQLVGIPLLPEPARYLLPAPDGSALVAGDSAGIVIARAFPWRDSDLPGDSSVPFAVRLDALKTYHPLLAPVWAQCQQAMAGGGAAGCPSGGEFTAPNGDTPPSCSVHGPLRNPANRLKQVLRYEAARSEEARAGLRPALYAALPESVPALKRLAADWVFGEAHWYHAARVACDKGLAKDPDNGKLVTAACAAALAVGDRDAAVRLTPRFIVPDAQTASILPELILAIAERGTAEDIAKAYSFLLIYLWDRRPDDTVRQAAALLRESPHAAGLEQAGQVERLLRFDSQSWRSLPWCKSLDEALARAEAESRPVLLVASVSDSAAMRWLREDIFSHPMIQDELLDHFVLADVNVDEAPELRERFNFTRLPELIFVAADGRLLKREPPDYSRNGFMDNIIDPMHKKALLRDWRIAGPFGPDGCPDIEQARTIQAGLDLDGEYAGRDGLVAWSAYHQPEALSEVPLSDLYVNAQNSVFYAYTCFEMPETGEAVLGIEFGETGFTWLDGAPDPELEKPGMRGQLAPREQVIAAGKHELLLRVSSRWRARYAAYVGLGKVEKAVPGLAPCAIPERPELIYLARHRDADTGKAGIARAVAGPDITEITVDKQQFLREWRDNYATILAILKPRPYFENGKPVGIQGDNLEQVPILLEAGVRNGDILVSVNGYRLGEGKTVLEIAELTEGSNPYVLEILREGKIHKFIVHVEGS